jgi:murein hydrolase activator
MAPDFGSRLGNFPPTRCDLSGRRRLKNGLRWSALLLALTAAASPSRAQEKPAEARRRDLEQIERRIASLKAQLAASERKAADLKEEVRRLDLKIEITSQELAANRERQSEVRERLVSLGSELAHVRTEHQQLTRAMRGRVLLLARLGRYGYFRLLLRARTVPELLASLRNLDALVRRDARLLRRYRTAALELDRDLAAQRQGQGEIEELVRSGRREELQAEGLRSDRARLLRQVENDASKGRREVSRLSDKAERLERLLDLLSRGASSEVGAAGIRAWKGVLDWPVQGRILTTFGRHRHPRFDVFTVSNGIEIEVPSGTPVHAVYAGHVVFARFFPEYGNMVILDHGDAVLSLYAHLQSIAPHLNDFLSAGEVVGLSGTDPSSRQDDLYFELRDQQKASDPVAWLR